MKYCLSLFKHLISRFVSWVNPSLVLLSLGFSLGLSTPVQAADFRSILPAKAIAYDAPSAESTKLYIMEQGYPVEVIVNLGAWVKVRDQRRGLSWVEGKDLDTKHTVLVTDNTEIKDAESSDAKLLATVEKDVVLELLSPSINKGWVKIKHRDGIVGYIQSSAIWGLY
jgi:SH3-like domain-containing protein